MSWGKEYVKAILDLGFTKVTIISRGDYVTVGYSSKADIATAWNEMDKSGKKVKTV